MLHRSIGVAFMTGVVVVVVVLYSLFFQSVHLFISHG